MVIEDVNEAPEKITAEANHLKTYFHSSESGWIFNHLQTGAMPGRCILPGG